MNRREYLKVLGASAALSRAAARPAACPIRVSGKEGASAEFGGVGFHNFHHLHNPTPEMRDQVLRKRWRELGASFARVTHQWQPDHFDALAQHALELKATGTTILLTTWDPPRTAPGEERKAYAGRVGAMLEELVRGRGATNVRYYCMTNELTLGPWGALRTDMPTFRDYHQAIYDDLRARRLDIGLLATDASPVDSWPTVEWAAANMDGITAVYGGHHYINDFGLDDTAFYPWFLEKTRWASGIAAARNKRFILGEFGAKHWQGPKVDGSEWDACHYFDTPLEAWVGIQVAEAVIAAINAGVQSMGYWTFADFPNAPTPGYANKWGLFKWSGQDFGVRPHYHAYGLLTRYFRGPARTMAVETGDPLVRAAAVTPEGAGGGISLAVINRRESETGVAIRIAGQRGAARFRKYVYDPTRPPVAPCGDLQDPAATVAVRGGALDDVLLPGSLTVYTSAFEERAPAQVTGLAGISNGKEFPVLQWQETSGPAHCYYRIFRATRPDFEPRGSNQIASTVATAFTDNLAGMRLPYFYKVRAVDRWGNAGPPSAAAQARYR